MLILDKRICTECGEEIDCGIRSTVAHMDECKRNAPNESIDSHRESVKWDDFYKKEEERMEAIYHKLTDEERETLMSYSYCGIPISSTVIAMGLKNFNRLKNYKEQLYAKYESK